MFRKNVIIPVAIAVLCSVVGMSGTAIIMATGQNEGIEVGNVASGLKCEGLERPIAINTLSPRLSWKLPVDWKSQSAYELQAGTDSISLVNGGATDLWASGKVVSTQSVNVEYAGEALHPGMQVYWRVMVWDENGRPSEWSNVSRFGVGYIDGNDMPGKYIGMSKRASGNIPQTYIMIPNRVYTGIANHRYNQKQYLDGIDYPVEYLGYSTVDKIHWDSDEVDRVEIHMNVKTSPDAVVDKSYRLEILSGDEESSYYQYVGNALIYNNATYDYSINSDNRLFENGTFASGDAGRYTPAGRYKEGDEKVYSDNEIKELPPSIRQVFDAKSPVITITAAQGRTDEVGVDAMDEKEYFDLKGIRVTNPRNGIYLRRTGKKVEKVIIR